MGRFEENEWTPTRSRPGHLYWHKVRDVRGEHVLLALIVLSHPWQSAKEDAALGDGLNHGFSAVHVREGVQHSLRSVREVLLCLRKRPERRGSPARTTARGQARLASLEQAGAVAE